ncbi:MAG: OmpA family protein [Marinoscillum sp.]
MSAFNSTSGENYIFFDFDNSKCYFSREKHPENTGKSKDSGDIWLSVLDSSWSNPKKLGLNDKTFQSPLGFSADEKYFLFNQVKFDKGLYYGSVFAVDLNSSQEPVEVAIPYFKNRSPLQTGSISADGRYLMLSLENNLGYGVDDIFICMLKSDGTWSSPKNLGNVVNTKYQELTPFIASDGKTLFFASNGHGGEGSFDIFQSTRLDDTWQNWTAPQNIGKSVNTSGAETSFVFNNDSEYAYFVSTQNSDGYGDIKRIKVQADFEDAQEEPEVINMVMKESNTNQIVFELYDSKSNQKLQGEALKIANEDTIRYQSNGNNQIVLNDLKGSIMIEFKSKGYFSAKHQFSSDELLTSTEPKAILLSPLESGSVITLEHVLFYRGTANFIEGSQDELDLVVEMMKENQDVEIFLKGHTDNQGNPIMNIQLSQERVLAVTAYLVEHGVEEDRITGKGFGGEEPIASNAEESSRKLNRRVEFEVRRD